MQNGQKGSTRNLRSNWDRAAAATAFRDYLQEFVFFHLGADARTEFLDDGRRIQIRIEHNRVRPIVFWLSEAELAALTDDTGREAYLLSVLTEARR